MKKYIYISFFILSASYAFAGTTSLTTWYPPPAAIYNTLKLATNYITSTVTSAGSCTNATTIFLNSATGTIYQCTGTGTATAYCTGANNGTMLTDSNGNLHICVSGEDTIYPQQSYNSFCTYDTSQNASGCRPTPVCAAGFAQVMINSSGYDNIQISATDYVNAYACSSTGYTTCSAGLVNGTCTAWSTCSPNTCNVAGGSETCLASTAQCGGTPTAGTTTQTCTGSQPQNGVWSTWSACSTQCGPGTQVQYCNNPAMGCNGAGCSGCSGAGCLIPCVNGSCYSTQSCNSGGCPHGCTCNANGTCHAFGCGQYANLCC